MSLGERASKQKKVLLVLNLEQQRATLHNNVPLIRKWSNSISPPSSVLDGSSRMEKSIWVCLSRRSFIYRDNRVCSLVRLSLVYSLSTDRMVA